MEMMSKTHNNSVMLDSGLSEKFILRKFLSKKCQIWERKATWMDVIPLDSLKAVLLTMCAAVYYYTSYTTMNNIRTGNDINS